MIKILVAFFILYWFVKIGLLGLIIASNDSRHGSPIEFPLGKEAP
jgi:hypothetical protein